MTKKTFDVCVAGGGPAGAVIAIRLAQLGHRVCIVERASEPRRRLGESLTPGVQTLLETIGLRDAAALSGGIPVRCVERHWDDESPMRDDADAQGVIVDRAGFDAMLLSAAETHGVEVMRGANFVWNPVAAAGKVRTRDGVVEVSAAFIVDATGRSGALPALRRATGPRTIGLYAYWQGVDRTTPLIEACDSAWVWAVPLPHGICNTLVFVDAARLHKKAGKAAAAVFHEEIAQSRLARYCAGATMMTHVRAADATPYVDDFAVTESSLKVGDAACALDPISSSGVQSAVQSAIAGAIVVNTILRRPDRAEAARAFYRSKIRATSERHLTWSAGHYATVAARRSDLFWQRRSVAGVASRAIDSGDVIAEAGMRLMHSPLLRITAEPCLAGDYVDIRPAAQHTSLDGPVAFLGGWPIVRLLQEVQTGMSAADIAQRWTRHMPPNDAAAILGWMVRKQLLIAIP